MESSGMLATLLGGELPSKPTETVALSDIERKPGSSGNTEELMAQSDVELLIAFNMSTRRAPDQQTTTPRAVQSRATNSDNTNNGQTNKRRPSAQPSSQQTDPSSLSEAGRISQPGHVHANNSTPPGTAHSNKPIAPKPARPSYCSGSLEAESKGVEMRRGNGDNDHRHGAPTNEQTTPNGQNGPAKVVSRRRKRSTPYSDKDNHTSPSKRAKPPGRFSEYLLQNNKDNEERLLRGDILSKEALEAGYISPEEMGKYSKLIGWRNSDSLIRRAQLRPYRQQSGPRNLIRGPPQQPMSPLTQPPSIQLPEPSSEFNQMHPGQRGFNVLSSQMLPTFNPGPPMQTVTGLFQNSPSHAGYGNYQSPYPPTEMMPIQAYTSLGGSFDSSPSSQSSQADYFGNYFQGFEQGMPNIQRRMMIQGQAQPPSIFFDANHPDNALQQFPARNANLFNAMQNQGGIQRQPDQSGYGAHSHPSEWNALNYSSPNAAYFNAFPNGN